MALRRGLIGPYGLLFVAVLALVACQAMGLPHDYEEDDEAHMEELAGQGYLNWLKHSAGLQNGNVKASKEFMDADKGIQVGPLSRAGKTLKRMRATIKTEQRRLKQLVRIMSGRSKGAQPESIVVKVGTPGPMGPRGHKGPRGDRGLVGRPGPFGKPGIKGDTGPKGRRGARGRQGRQGPRGKKGRRGTLGPEGHRGVKGARGPRGVVGGAGYIGPPGPPGRQGRNGPTGQVGPRGRPGHRGAQGATGPQGRAGRAAPCRGSTQYSGAGVGRHARDRVNVATSRSDGLYVGASSRRTHYERLFALRSGVHQGASRFSVKAEIWMHAQTSDADPTVCLVNSRSTALACACFGDRGNNAAWIISGRYRNSKFNDWRTRATVRYPQRRTPTFASIEWVVSSSSATRVTIRVNGATRSNTGWTWMPRYTPATSDLRVMFFRNDWNERYLFNRVRITSKWNNCV